jgi:spore coat polysaccharide biosynthesis protein SpsF
VIVATTTESQDDAVAELARARGWPCTRGSRDDVLDRYYRAAADHGADVVVRVTGDCPFIEPVLVDRVVAALLGGWPDIDLSCNIWPRRTFPRGLDAEALTAAALARVWHDDDSPATREHVTAYIYKNPQRYRIVGVHGEYDLSGHRWTVDTPEDWALAECLYHYFGHDQFRYGEVLSALARYPEWSELNRGIEQKAV